MSTTKPFSRPPQYRRTFLVWMALPCLMVGVSTATLDAQSRDAAPRVTARRFRNLVYAESDHPRQKLDLYLPVQGKEWPLIVWVHGGAWRGGNKKNCPAVEFVDDGYAVASVNYRLSQHDRFPAQIEDCKAAIRWLRARADRYGYGDRIGVWGASAGGHLAALLGTTGDIEVFEVGNHLQFSSRVHAVVDFFGPTDFRQMNSQAGEQGRLDHDAPDSPESQLLGGPIQQHPQRVAEANPITYVSADDPPFLIMHGENDYTVPVGQSRRLHAALVANDVTSKLVIVPDAGHGFRNSQVNEQVRSFFDQHLKPR